MLIVSSEIMYFIIIFLVRQKIWKKNKKLDKILTKITKKEKYKFVNKKLKASLERIHWKEIYEVNQKATETCIDTTIKQIIFL